MNTPNFPSSLTGHILQGKHLVRIAYLDEAGISNPAQEPYLVVAGVLIHGDKDWPKVHQELGALATKYGLPNITSFHAEDIHHGSRLFDRKDPKWPNSRRRALLAELAALPSKLKLPVVVGFINRKTFAAAWSKRQKEIKQVIPDFKAPVSHTTDAHIEAFVNAARAIDYWLQTNTKAEQALIIAENTGKVQRHLKLAQLIYRAAEDIHLQFVQVRPFKSQRIIETVYFAEKNESPMLQLADICAFTIKRHLMRKPEVLEYYRAIEPQIVRAKWTATDSALEFSEMMHAWKTRLS